ncbi:kelch-like protein 21 [Saccostrea echinata]|uniref:kelch-like protein 21 n=1 Tax=Saccostrea echinata TaxID=191078 RepID=UPI002A82580A|nr:kelch-like protein 21 [Saccostrea echinata]
MAETESERYSDDDGFPETDVTLLVDDKKIHVNKAVLSQHSPVFSAMFSGSFKESTEREITLKNKKAKDVIEFLRCFYPNMKHAITESNVLQILPLAHEYQSPLVADCEKFMTDMCKPGTGLTVTTLLDYILTAEKYDLNTLLDTAVEFCGHVDFDLLNGRTFERKEKQNFKKGFLCTEWNYDVQETKYICSKFLEMNLKTQHAISVRRLQVLEMNKRKMKNEEEEIEEDYVIKLT